MSHDEQDDKQVFTQGPDPSGSDGSGSPASTRHAGGSDVNRAKIGCTPQTLHDWVKKAEVDSGQRAGVPTDTAES